MAVTDEILIQGLELPVQIGVPEEERAGWQVLRADISLRPRCAFSEMGDEIDQTIDYQAVANVIRSLAASRPRKLIETLAHEIAVVATDTFKAQSVNVTLRKRILPGTDCVAVRTERIAEMNG